MMRQGNLEEKLLLWLNVRVNIGTVGILAPFHTGRYKEEQLWPLQLVGIVLYSCSKSHEPREISSIYIYLTSHIIYINLCDTTETHFHSCSP